MINYITVPTAEILTAFEATARAVERWVDIYEPDNETIWMSRAPFVDGSVNVDMSRSERRNLEITFADTTGEMGYGPTKFWYDKIIKPYRGLRLANGDIWVAQLGEFMIDQITRPRFPNNLAVTCRDFSKALIQDKFANTISFAAGTNVGTIIEAIASNGGIVKFDFVTVTNTLTSPVVFERGTERWTAITKLAEMISHEVFFSRTGYLVLRPYVDPLTAPVSFTFRHGVPTANLVDFSKSTNDTRVFNDVVVYGDGPSNPLVFGQAENTAPTSPTRIYGSNGINTGLSRRTYTRASQVIQTNTEAQALAEAILAVSALEQYDMSLSSFVIPWLEAGEAVEVETTEADVGDPTRFLLTNFSIPLELGNMDGSAKRVTIVGA